MTALNLASIPSAINTIEALLVWCGMFLQSTTNGLQVNAVAGEAQVPAAGVTIGKIADNTDRAVVLAYVPIDINQLNSPTQKAWMAARDLSNAAPHSNLLSN
jgi:ABC-type xylose transport system permease subunit